MSKLRVIPALVCAVVVAPMLAVGGAAPASAATNRCLDATVPTGLDPFVWTGEAGNDRWQSPGNWFGDDAPNNGDAATAWVCIDALNDQDPGDTVYLVHESENPGTDNTSATSAMVQAVDVMSGTLSINRGGKLAVYGDHSTRPSSVRPGAHLDLTMGYLGGPGLINIDGTMTWARQRYSSSLVSSCQAMGIGSNCPPTGLSSGSGRMVVNGTLIVRKLGDDVFNTGVNLADRYDLEVAGTLRMVGPTYIAQAHTTSIEIAAPSGELVFDGDGDIYEGAFEGVPDALPPFVNNGTVRKVGGSGSSSINTAYQGDGAVVVEPGHGAITTPGGFPIGASVPAEDSVGTWQCPTPDSSSAYTDCAFDSTADASVTSEADPQAAQFTVPATAGTPALVEIRETDQSGPNDLQPQIEVDVEGLAGNAVSELEFEFNNRILSVPAKGHVRLFRRAGGAEWQEVPRCREGGGSPFPNGVTACMRGPARDRSDHRAVLATVITTTPTGGWVLRGDRTIVVPRARNQFDVEGARDSSVSALVLPDVPDDHCSDAQDVRWTLRRELVSAATDDHAVGWWPSAAGRARGFSVAVGDLAEVNAFAVRLRVGRVGLRGYAQAVRHESASVKWVGRTTVVQDDAPFTDDPPWRLLQGADLTYVWQRYDGGLPDGTPTFIGTVAEFVEAHAAKSPATDPDTVGFAFGCNGERVTVNDLTVATQDVPAGTVWDLEVPRSNVSLRSSDIGDVCQVSSATWPNRVRRRISATPDARWRLEWRPDSPASRWRQLDPRVSGVGGAERTIRLPQQKGLLQAVVPPNHSHRVSASQVVRFKAVPRIDLGSITRSTKKKPLRIGHVIQVKGQFAPGGRKEVRLWRTTSGGDVLMPTRSTDTVRDGRFTLRFKPSKTGRYAFAVEYDGSGRVNGAVSRRAFFTKVFRKPSPPQQQSAPAPTLPPPSDQAPVYPPPIPGRGAPAGCVFNVRN